MSEYPIPLPQLASYDIALQELTMALHKKMSRLRGLDAIATAFAGVSIDLFTGKRHLTIEDCRSMHRQLAVNSLAALMRAKELPPLCVGLAYRYESMSGSTDGEQGVSVVVSSHESYLQIAWPDGGTPYWVLNSHDLSEGSAHCHPPELLEALRIGTGQQVLT